jgi:hypothetical protein
MRFALWSLVLLPGCASHEVRCDTRLLPINAPAEVRLGARESPAVQTPADRTPVDKTPVAASPASESQ